MASSESKPSSNEAAEVGSATDIECCSESSTNEDSLAAMTKGRWHQGLFRAGAILPTGICLGKAAVGAGVLSMAAHSAGVGLVYQLFALVLGGALNVVSIGMISEASIETGCWSFEDLCGELFHPALSLLTGFINASLCLGSGAAYLIICGQVFEVLTGVGDAWRQIFVVLVGVLVCMPLALARHVSFMRYLATLSILGLLFLVLVVAGRIGAEGPSPTVTVRTLLCGPGGVSVFVYMNSLNNVVLAYNNSSNVPQLTGEITPKPSVRRMTWSAFLSTVMCGVLYALVSLFGTVAFGLGEQQRETLVLDLVVDRGNPLVITALAAVMLSVLTCFQFHVYPIRQFFKYVLRKAQGRGVGDEACDTKIGSRSLARWLDIACALGTVVLQISIAVVITSLMRVLDFIGAFAAAYLAFVIPPLFIIQIRRRQVGFSWWKYEIMLCFAVHALGVFFFVFGTYAATTG